MKKFSHLMEKERKSSLFQIERNKLTPFNPKRMHLVMKIIQIILKSKEDKNTSNRMVVNAALKNLNNKKV